jgi:hypothetical protein
MKGLDDGRSHAQRQQCQSSRETTARVIAFLIALPFNVLEAIGRAGFYGAWHLLYFVACAFRAFTGFMVVAAVVMLPMVLGFFVDPSTAPMPWWVFLLSALGMFAFAVGYNLFLDWFAPPGAEDPFGRYRRSTSDGNLR